MMMNLTPRMSADCDDFQARLERVCSATVAALPASADVRRSALVHKLGDFKLLDVSAVGSLRDI